MSIADDQKLVREANDQRRAARTWAEKRNDTAWLQQRVNELEKWHVNQHSWHIDDDDPERLRICRGEHGPDDGCSFELYKRCPDEGNTTDDSQ